MNWLRRSDFAFYKGGERALKYYYDSLKKRKEEYPYKYKKYNIKPLQKEGFHIFQDVFSKKQIESLKSEFDFCVDNNKINLSDEYFTIIDSPLLNSKTSFEIATSDIIYDISSQFFNCVPSLCTQNFRLSKINSGEPKATQLFHCDENSIKFIKFFIYLNDVGIDDGPLTYVRGSNSKKPVNHLSKYRWHEDEIRDIYGNNIVYLTASAGDMIIADTTGFHRGTKPLNKERSMLTLNYVIHEEKNMNTRPKARKEWVNRLPEHKKPLFNFMELV